MAAGLDGEDDAAPRRHRADQGRPLQRSDPVRVSERSAHTGGSRVGLQEGQIYPLGELIKAALIKSANDAAVAIAEKVGGSVEAMVRMMNHRAQELGMTHTLYQTVDGLPPRPTHDADITTAHDLARVAYQIIHTTDLLKWSSQEQCPFDGGVCMLHTTNHLIGHFDGCDGLKTGFTFQAGFNLTATAKRGNMRFISVILGAPSNQSALRPDRRSYWIGASTISNRFQCCAEASRCRFTCRLGRPQSSSRSRRTT